MAKGLQIELPPSMLINGRRFFRRSEIEHLKRSLMARATGAAAPDFEPLENEIFVPAPQVARELGLSHRTFWRRVADSGKANS